MGEKCGKGRERRRDHSKQKSLACAKAKCKREHSKFGELKDSS